MEKNPQDSYRTDYLDMRATKGCSFLQCKKEAIITIIAYLIYASFTIAVSGIFGFGADISYTFGIPTWIVLGLLVPTVALILYLIVYLQFIYKD